MHKYASCICIRQGVTNRICRLRFSARAIRFSVSIVTFATSSCHVPSQPSESSWLSQFRGRERSFASRAAPIVGATFDGREAQPRILALMRRHRNYEHPGERDVLLEPAFWASEKLAVFDKKPQLLHALLNFKYLLNQGNE